MDILQILEVKFPDSEWTLEGETYEGLNWLSESPKPTQEELEGLWDEVKAELEAKENSKIDARASLLAKLAALGLTEEEIAAL
jgi:hypothetical protein